MRTATLVLLLALPLAAQEANRELEDLKEKMEEMSSSLQALVQERQASQTREEKLARQVQELNRQLQDLRARAMLAEKVEVTQRVPVWICPGGHVSDVEPGQGSCPVCGKPMEKTEEVRKAKVARREAIGDKIQAALDADTAKRVTVAVSGTGVFQQILSHAGGTAKNSSHVEGSTDLFLITRPLPYSLFFIDMEAIGGRGPDAVIGSQADLNNDAARRIVQTEGDDSISLREAWFRKDLLDDRLHLIGGKIDLTNYFDRNRFANDETTQFLTGGFVHNPVLNNPVLNGAGVAALFETRTGWQFGLGYQEPTDRGVKFTDRPYSIGEIDWKTYALGREGNLRVWGRSDQTEPFESTAVGVSIDQELSAKVGVFARWGEAWTDHLDDPWAWSFGVRLTPTFESRPRDVWALAFGQQRGAFDHDEGHRDTYLETYYRLVLNDHFSVTPLFQYLFHTAGNGSTLEAEDDVGVLGLRVQIDF